MSDLISRADAIDACCRGWNNIAEDCIRNIKALPSAESPKGELISRADAICEVLVNDGIDNIVDRINKLPSAEHKNCWDCKHYEQKHDVCHAPELVKQVTSKLKKPCDSLLTDDTAECKEQKSKLESADAESDDLIIKGAKGIKDGLYNIKDGKLFEYKAKGGTVRVYSIVPSAEAVQGEWVEHTDCEGKTRTITCSECGWEEHSWIDTNYCPNCGARMKGGGE